MNPTLKRSGFCFPEGLEDVMNWALFGAIWSFEMVVVFGYLALRCRSFIYPLALHWVAGGSFDLFCCLAR